MGSRTRNFANNVNANGRPINVDVAEFDDNKIVNDLSTLGLRVHTQENLNASNTNSQYVDVFQDASGYTNGANTVRDSNEYVSSVSISSESGGTQQYMTSLSEGGSYFSCSSTGQVIYTHSNSYNFSWYKNADLSGNYWLRVKTYESHSNDPSGNTNYGWQFGIDKNDDVSRNTGHSIWYRDDSNAFWVGCRGNVSSGRIGYLRQRTEQAYQTSFNSSSSSYFYFVRNTADGGTLKLYYGDYTDSANLLHTYSGYSGTQTDAFMGALGQPNGESKTGNFGMFTGVEYKKDITTLGGLGTASATGNFLCPAITAASSTSKMGAVITYQDNAGTNVLNTDIILQLSADNGSNFSTATLTALPDFSSGIKMAKVNDLPVTAGTQLKYKILFANQAQGSKEARIRGVSLNY